jgi:hypothetical protein
MSGCVRPSTAESGSSGQIRGKVSATQWMDARSLSATSPAGTGDRPDSERSPPASLAARSTGPQRPVTRSPVEHQQPSSAVLLPLLLARLLNMCPLVFKTLLGSLPFCRQPCFCICPVPLRSLVVVVPLSVIRRSESLRSRLAVMA